MTTCPSMENFVGPYKANPATIDLGCKVQLVCVHVVVITKNIGSLEFQKCHDIKLILDNALISFRTCSVHLGAGRGGGLFSWILLFAVGSTQMSQADLRYT